MSNLGPTDLIGQGIVTAIRQSADAMAKLQGRIYDTVAPPGVPLPFCVYALVSGGEMNTSPRMDVEVEMTIEVIATDVATASLTMEAINSVIAGNILPGIGSSIYSNYWVSRGRMIHTARYVEAQLYITRGAWYEIRMDKRG